jgi:hypothetical protein
MRRFYIGALVAAASLTMACSSGIRKFPLKDPMWVDQDKRPFTEEPEEYYSSFLWDGADQMAFRPFAKLWKLNLADEAMNVNAMDEVPDSSWFTNRIGRRTVGLEEVRRGPCSGPPLDPTKGPWTVVGAKPNGANPGFPIKAADGRRYMLKYDGVVQGPRATTADTVVSKIYHAAGFDVPCNEVVFFDRSILQIDPEAMSRDAAGNKVPMTDKDLDTIFSKAVRLPDGRYRSSASLFLSGKPIGPFRYEETRGDDPNDVIPHQERRELRGAYVLAGWVNHFDAREQNSLDMFVDAPGDNGGYVQHNYLDFGDCFGSIWEPPMMGRRIGYSHYFAADHIFIDLLTFGTIKRPWDTNRFSVTKKVFGYYQIDNFVPDEYRPGYPNPAMLRMTEHDGAWMARVIARMTPAHIKSMIEGARLQDKVVHDELVRVVLGRRMKVLARYLSRLSALTDPEVKMSATGRPELCMDDLGITAGVFPAMGRRYGARAFLGNTATKQEIAQIRTTPKVCVDLPVVGGASQDSPRYLMVDMYALSGSQPAVPARVHLYHLGGTNYKVVGLERPDNNDPPG